MFPKLGCKSDVAKMMEQSRFKVRCKNHDTVVEALAVQAQILGLI